MICQWFDARRQQRRTVFGVPDEMQIDFVVAVDRHRTPSWMLKLKCHLMPINGQRKRYYGVAVPPA
jgi:hypothetical protein